MEPTRVCDALLADSAMTLLHPCVPCAPLDCVVYLNIVVLGVYPGPLCL